MVSSGYATEETFEAIWDFAIATARFDAINVRIGTILNFLILGDGSTDTTDTKATEMLAHITEEIILKFLSAARVQKNDPDTAMNILSLSSIRRDYGADLQQIAITIGNTEVLEVSSVSGLGASNTL